MKVTSGYANVELTFEDNSFDPSFQDLSPVQKYQKLVEMINTKCVRLNINRSTLFSDKQEIEKSEHQFQIEEDNKKLPMFVGTAAIGGLTIGGISNRILNASSPTNFRSPLSEKISSGSSSPFGFTMVGIALTGLGVMFARSTYRKLATEIRNEIDQAFQSIADDSIDHDKLSNSIEMTIQKKEQSMFNRVFEYYNPIPMGYLLFTKGIALDSKSDFSSAQEQYVKVLQYNIDNRLRNIIHFVLARSFRLSNGRSDLILEQINKIDQTSPLYRLGQIEKKCMDLSKSEVFDEDGIPVIFKCPIKVDIMIDPVFYEKNNFKFYFEREAIESWIKKRGTCPLTDNQLQINDLIADDILAEAIKIWTQTKLKSKE